MKRLALIIGIAIALVAGVVAVVANIHLLNPPTFISGDPWDYNLTPADMPEGWTASDSNIKTAFDMTQDGHTDLGGLQMMHAVQLSDRLAVDVFDLTSQVLIYDSVDSAKAAFAKETPGDEWEPVQTSAKLGDATAVWHLKSVNDAPQQATYRADVQYLNAVTSVTVTGTIAGMNNESAALEYAKKVVDKFQRNARPDALGKLGTRPDLRTLILSQAELAKVDTYFGDLWLYNPVLQPGWTANSDFPNPAGMDALGRVMGYQAWFIKPLFDEEVKPDTAVTLFEQVTAYNSAPEARVVLDKMVGLNDGQWPVSPPVGDAAKAWTKVVDASGTSAGKGVVISVEISFQQGSYIGSIRLESPAITNDNDVLAARSAVDLLANQLALNLARKLEKAQN